MMHKLACCDSPTTTHDCRGLLALQGWLISMPQPIAHLKRGTKATAMGESTWQSLTAPCTSRGWPLTAPSTPMGVLSLTSGQTLLTQNMWGTTTTAICGTPLRLHCGR